MEGCLDLGGNLRGEGLTSAYVAATDWATAWALRAPTLYHADRIAPLSTGIRPYPSAPLPGHENQLRLVI